MPEYEQMWDQHKGKEWCDSHWVYILAIQSNFVQLNFLFILPDGEANLQKTKGERLYHAILS